MRLKFKKEHTAEKWKPYPLDRRYLVSTLGRVQGVKGNLISSIPDMKRGNYQRVFVAGSKRSTHVVVLETFVGPRPEGAEACHKDGNRQNNRLSNLYWGTRSDNMQDAVRHGTHKGWPLKERTKSHREAISKAIKEWHRRRRSCVSK